MSDVDVDADVEVDEPEQPPRRSLAVLVPVAVVVAIVGFVVVVLATREPAANRVVRSPLVGEPAPAIVGSTLAGGSYDLADERGRFVLVNFFASWCVPCQREHDDLARWDEHHRALGDAGVMSVVYSDDTDAVREFFAENGGDWPVVISDVDGGTAVDYGVAGVPESFLVAPDGTVVAKIVGGVTEAGLDDLLARFTGAWGG